MGIKPEEFTAFGNALVIVLKNNNKQLTGDDEKRIQASVTLLVDFMIDSTKKKDCNVM